MALVEGYGIELTKLGQNHVGRCDRHPDEEPSLVVTPSKGLWACKGACGVGGSQIDFVMWR